MPTHLRVARSEVASRADRDGVGGVRYVHFVIALLRRHSKPRARAVLTLLACLALAIGCASRETPSPGPTPPASALVIDAQRAHARGDYTAAVEGYRAALEKTPWNERLRASLVSVLVDRATATRLEGGVSAIDRAIVDLREARTLAPAEEVVQRDLAVLLLERSQRTTDPERAAVLRQEASDLAPDLAEQVPDYRPEIERRLDLAYELVERGQLDAGIARLEALEREFAERPDVRLLLAQALVLRGSRLASQGEHPRAAGQFERAIALYQVPGVCDGACATRELALAHRNRIVAWLNAPVLHEARRALDQAEREGLSFPELERALLEAAR